MTPAEIEKLLADATQETWVLDDNEGYGPVRIWAGMSPTGHGNAGAIIAQIVGDSAEAEANARLIAAAPDLARLALDQARELERLREVLDNLLDAITAENNHGDRALTITGSTANLKWLIEATEDARAALTKEQPE